MYLFSSIKLILAGQMVEHVNYPGQATSLLGLGSYSPDYSKGCGLIQGWTPDIKANTAVANTGFPVRQWFLIQSTDPKGSFQCAIPMRHIFGFMDDLWDARYIAVWVVPIVQPNDVLKIDLYKSIAATSTIPVAFGGVNVKCSLYLEQDPLSGDWVYWLDCKEAKVVSRKEMLPFLIIET